MNTKFNPFDMATHGLLSGNSFTISIQGHLTLVEITPIPPTPIDKIKRVGGSFIPTPFKGKEKKRYEIKVTIIKNGEKYVETKEVKSIKTPTIKDINISFEEQTNKVIVEIINPEIYVKNNKIKVKFL